MSCRVLRRTATFVLTIALTFSTASIASQPWTPVESVKLRNVVYDPSYPLSNYLGADPLAWSRSERPEIDPIVYSDDGKYFFVASYVGDQAVDRIVQTLSVFRVSDVKDAMDRNVSGPIKPLLSRDFASTSGGRPGLLDQRWDAADGILFRAIDAHDRYQAFRLDVSSATTTKLIDLPGSADWFDYNAGTLIVREQIPPNKSTNGPPIQAVSLREDGSVNIRRFAREATSYRALVQVDTATLRDTGMFLEAAVSPDGARIAVYDPDRRVVEITSARTGRVLTKLPDVALGIIPSNGSRLNWSTDGALLAVSLGGGSDVGSPSITMIRIDDGSRQRVVDLDPNVQVRSFGFCPGANGIWVELLDSQYQQQRRAFRTTAQASAKPTKAPCERLPSNAGLRIRVKQGLNSPPRVIATLRGSHRVLQIGPEDKHAARPMPVSIFSWTDFDGEKRSGGLVLPRKRQPNGLVPIVIQPYHFFPNLFLPDGHNRTTDVAQSLASRGIGVLMIESMDLIDPAFGPLSHELEGEKFVRRIDAVVDALEQEGIASRDNIGLLGFSRGGYQVHYAISHPGKTQFRAVSIGDSTTQSYPEYLETQAVGSLLPEAYYQGRSFWRHPSLWLKHDVLFNNDRVKAPALFFETEVDSIDNSPASLQILGAFKVNNNPVDYYYVRSASHTLQVPSLRVGVHTIQSDWFSYWMLQEKDPDSGKAERYRRWAALRRGQPVGTNLN